jgi:ribosomal protein eL43
MKDVEDKLKAKHECPNCRHPSVKRKSTGIWECRHCGIVFAGGAYVPKPSEPTKLEEKIKEELAEKTAERKEREKQGKAVPGEEKGKEEKGKERGGEKEA